jgi:hypothetical protein
MKTGVGGALVKYVLLTRGGKRGGFNKGWKKRIVNREILEIREP